MAFLWASVTETAMLDGHWNIMTTRTNILVGVAWLALLVLPAFLLITNRQSAELETDERDKLILRWSIVIACWLLCVVVFLAPAGTLFVLERPMLFPFVRLADIVCVSFIAVISTLTIVVRNQYGLGGRHAEE